MDNAPDPVRAQASIQAVMAVEVEKMVPVYLATI